MLKKIFKTEKPIIGMIHTDALPGTPNYTGNVKSIIKKAKEEAGIYKREGIDSIMIENMHDVPYLKNHVGPEITSLMSIVGYEIKNLTGLPTGIQILAGANMEALAAANSAGLDFIRAEGFVFAHVADEGIIESDAGKLLRYRKMIGAGNIAVFTDIKKKHSSHSITSDVSLVETAKAAEFFLSDGIIITGKSTGEEAGITEIQSVKNNVKLPVLAGSGINPENFEKYFEVADGFIIGSYFKKNGIWKNGVDAKRVSDLMEKARTFRK